MLLGTRRNGHHEAVWREDSLRIALAPAVAAQRLVKRYAKHEVLRNVSLTVPTGITFGLIGPNGCGKTTLLRVLAGVLRANAGDVSILGRTIEHAREIMGYMPQQVGLYTHMTVWENIRFFAGVYSGVSQDNMREALEMADALHLRSRRVGELSLGTQRRISLACALAHRPRVLLLDEPTAGVDPVLRRAFWQHFAQLNTDGVTIIIATQDMDEAEWCDELGLLRDGRLLEQGSPEQLCEKSGLESVEDVFIWLAGMGI